MITYLLAFLGITPFFIIGHQILDRPLLYDNKSGLALALGAVLGLGIIALLTMSLGVLKILYGPVLWGLITLAWALVASSGMWRPFAGSVAETYRSQRELFSQSGAIYKIILTLFIFTCGIYLAGALIPQMGSDALFQHYLLSKIFIRNASLTYIPEIYTGAWPSNIQMLYTFAMLVHGQFAANCISVLSAILFSALIFQYLNSRLNPDIALLLALVFLTLPMVLFQVAKAMVDLETGMFAFSGLFILLMELDGQKPRSSAVALAGIFFGLAAGSKLPAISYLLPALVILLLAQVRWSMRKAIKNSFILALYCLAVSAPWYVRSLILTGDPLFPMLSHILGTAFENGQATENLLAFYNNDLAQMGRSVFDLWKLPIFILFPETVLDILDVVERLKPSYPKWTFLSAIFLPFGLVHGLRQRDANHRDLFLTATVLILYALIWFFLYPQRLRHLLVAIPFLLLFTGIGMQFIRSQKAGLRNMTHGLCAIWLAMAFLGVLYYYTPRVHGIFDNNAYYLKYRRWDGAIRVINSKLSEDDVLFTTFYAFTPYYLHASVLSMGLSGSLNRLTIDKAQHPEDLFDYLTANRVDYVLHSPEMVTDDSNAMESILKNEQMFTLVWKEDELLKNSRTFNVNKKVTLYLYKFHP